MRTLIKDLLDLSRIGRGIIFEKVNCDELIQEVIGDMSGAIAETGTKLAIDDLPTVRGSTLELKLLFQNLISNAIKFRKKDTENEIIIRAVEKEKEFLFSVADNGIGIDQQYLQRVFVIFQRLHRSSEYPGTGIGLASCKKIVNRHHGEIWVESVPGHGSTFYFTIPK